MRIKHIDAIQIFDSRGNPTVEAVVTLDDESIGRGIVPSGASTGKYEALELRDGVPGSFGGKSVQQAIGNILSKIAPALLEIVDVDQQTVDRRMIELDGTPNKSELGANAILAVSMAFCRAAAESGGLPLYEHLGGQESYLLPLPEIQIIGGGAHAGRAIDVQDFMIIALRADCYEDALEVTFNIYHEAANLLKERGQLVGLADEGGFWPVVDSNEEVFELLLAAIRRAGYTPGEDVGISLDIAAADLYQDGTYVLASEQRSFSSKEFTDFLLRWVAEYPIVSIEDPLADDDWDEWQRFTKEVGDHVQIIGDDLFTTNLSRIRKGIERRAANAVLVKLNQIGTVSETLDAIHEVQSAGWNPVVSARSGETEDAFISHLAVATNAGQLKVGSFARSERMVKWNEVLRIGHELSTRAHFIGGRILKGDKAE